MRKNFARLASISFIGGAVGYALRYLLNVVVARGFGVEILGVFALGMVITKGGSVFARGGLDHASQRFIPRYIQDNQNSRVLGIVLTSIIVPVIFGSLLSVVLLIAKPIFKPYISTWPSGVFFLFVLGIPLFASLSVTANATKGFKETKYKIIAKDLSQSGIALVLVAVGAFIFSDFHIAISGYLVSLVIGFIISVMFLVGNSAVDLSVSPKLETRELIAFGLPILLIAVARYLLEWTDLLMLGIFVSDSAIGQYHAAYQTSVLLLFVLHSASSIFAPIASEAYSQSNRQRLDSLYTAVTKWVTYVSLLGCMFLIIFTPTILGAFEANTQQARTALRILAVGQMLTAISGPVGFMLSMSEYERIEAVNTLVMLFINIVVNYILISQYGIVGAAVGTGASLALRNIIGVIEIWYLFGFLPYTTQYWKGGIAVGVSTIVMVSSRLVLSMVPISDLFNLFVSGIMAALIFIGLLIILGLDQTDRILFESV